ncbi:PolA DNA polymerase I - 3'-5' exonuclease and polymerase domains [uncultured Caudovirales phage]|uniref:DNA-directed DNA polymerase n=1 Tax=uncultured Caudovirales phage TaxID=2100421 RepID=A0A6J5KLT3_9CAUD|nr:PolA DNA polymerase I - 3'-5' exonuclease and polymerase domains [uncultured Caudovirales phage]
MNIITTDDQLSELVAYYMAQDAFVFDVETMGDHRGDPRQNQVVWIALATDGRVDVIPMGHPNGEYIRTEYPLLPSAQDRIIKGLPLRAIDYSKDERKATKIFGKAPEQLSPGEVFLALKPLFFSDLLKIGHNLKFDIQSVSKYIGGLPSRPYACTLNAAFILDTRNSHHLGLDDCLKREFDYNMVKGVGAQIEIHTFDDVATYAGLDADWTWKLWNKYAPRLEKDNVHGVFNLEMDILHVISKMELHGADIDVEALKVLKANLELQLETTKADIYRLAGKAFNINSVPEKQKLLFSAKKDGGRGLRPRVLTPKGITNSENGLAPVISDFSVSEPALKAFQGKDALVDALLNYSDLNKLLTTYVIPYLGGDITRTTAGKAKTVAKKALLLKGRIHTDFIQYGADTGRFSSRNPNLQNVPNPRTINGKAIRNLFVAPEGHQLVVADYSQIEPRILSSFSGDRILCQNYIDGVDIYTTIGDTVGIDRSGAKTLVLGMMYGIGPEKIASSIGVSGKEARDLLDSFANKFPSISKYKRKVVAETRRRGPVPYALTYMNRRRYLPDMLSPEIRKRAGAERQAFNTVIQGSAADLIKLAMVRADSLLPDGAAMILTIHDELVTVAPKEIIEETAAAIREAMEGIKALSIPMLADVKIVNKWGEAK